MIHPSVAAVKVIVLILSLTIAYLAFHGYRRNKSIPMMYVAVGFIFIGVGSICEGVLYHGLGTSTATAGIVQAVVVSTGFIFIFLSLRAQPM